MPPRKVVLNSARLVQGVWGGKGGGWGPVGSWDAVPKGQIRLMFTAEVHKTCASSHNDKQLQFNMVITQHGSTSCLRSAGQGKEGG